MEGRGFEAFAKLIQTELPLNPKSEVDRRHSAPSFGAQVLPALGTASLDAARFGTASPCAPKHGTDCLALNFGFRVETNLVGTFRVTLVWLALDAPQDFRGAFVKRRQVIAW